MDFLFKLDIKLMSLTDFYRIVGYGSIFIVLEKSLGVISSLLVDLKDEDALLLRMALTGYIKARYFFSLLFKLTRNLFAER